MSADGLGVRRGGGGSTLCSGFCWSPPQHSSLSGAPSPVSIGHSLYCGQSLSAKKDLTHWEATGDSPTNN